MAVTELMLLHGLGGRAMATRNQGYKAVFDARTKQYVWRATGRRRAKKVSGLGNLGTFGQAAGLKGSLKGIKGVLITGAIAAGGAIVTQQIFDKIASNWSVSGWKRDVAQIGLGIGLGILIAKVLKKPKLAAAFAIGPVVAGAIRIFGGLMPGSVSGLGYTAFSPANAYESMYAPLYGADGLGLNTYEALAHQAPGTPPPPGLSSAVSYAGGGV